MSAPTSLCIGWLWWLEQSHWTRHSQTSLLLSQGSHCESDRCSRIGERKTIRYEMCKMIIKEVSHRSSRRYRKQGGEHLHLEMLTPDGSAVGGLPHCGT